MIVDDEEDIRLVTRLILEEAGYEVSEAATGLEALARLDAQIVDLMVLDIRMSGMDGWQVIDAVEQRGFSDRLRILGFSAHVERGVFDSAMERGCSGVLVKPFTREACLDAVLAALA
jgi:CheY-like chemotaxis protein